MVAMVAMVAHGSVYDILHFWTSVCLHLSWGSLVGSFALTLTSLCQRFADAAGRNLRAELLLSDLNVVCVAQTTSLSLAFQVRAAFPDKGRQNRFLGPAPAVYTQ